MLAIKLVTPFRLRSISTAVALAMCLGLALADNVSDLQGLIAAGKATEALKRADQLLGGKPDDPELSLQRGIALSLLNRQSESIIVFQKLIESHPELPGPYNNLAVLYANQGEYEKARRALELAIRTNPIYATASQNLGDIYAHLAGQAYKKALALDKSGASLPLRLAAVQNVFEPSVDPRGKKADAARPAAAPAPAPAPLASPAPVPTAATPRPAPPVAAKPATAAPAALVAKAAPVAASAVLVKPEPVRAIAADTEQQLIEKAVRTWAQAWSQRDMSAYYAAYAPDFKGTASSRKAWEADRRVRIVGKKKISVTLSEIHVKVSGDSASIRFRQNYTSDVLSVRSSKSMEMVKSKSGDWRITTESSS